MPFISAYPYLVNTHLLQCARILAHKFKNLKIPVVCLAYFPNPRGKKTTSSISSLIWALENEWEKEIIYCER